MCLKPGKCCKGPKNEVADEENKFVSEKGNFEEI